jgi:hypothetical protein
VAYADDRSPVPRRVHLVRGQGDLIVSPVADGASLLKIGIRPEGKVSVGVFLEGQRVFLGYRRENVLRMSRRR